MPIRFVSGDLRAAVDAIRLARRTLRTIKGNLFWAFAYNIAAIPLLWILPLTIYLLTFVLAFNGRKIYSRRLMMGLLPSALGGVGYLIVDTTKDVPIVISIPLFCLTLFICAFFCHGELYRRRPQPEHLTSFYLMIALGGVAGSAFVNLVAPFIFMGNWEMHIGIAASLIAMAVMATTDKSSWANGKNPFIAMV